MYRVLLLYMPGAGQLGARLVPTSDEMYRLLPAETELQLQQVGWVLRSVKALWGVAAAAVAREAGRGWVAPLAKVRC